MTRFLPAVGEDATEPPIFHGAARQSFGSGALRKTDDETLSNKIHKDKKEKLWNRGERENIDDALSPSSHGVLIKTAPFPPYSARYPGGKNPPLHTGVPDYRTIFHPSGRREESWINQGVVPGREVIFRSPEDSMNWDETSLLTVNHQSQENPAECDVTCGPMEFFCTKSCSCIGSDLHCGMIDMVYFVDSFQKNIKAFETRLPC